MTEQQYSNFRKYAHPLHVKEGIITEKVFPVFSESFFWTCFGLVMYIWELMGVAEKFAFQMWKNNIDLLGFMRELLRGGIFTVIFFLKNCWKCYGSIWIWLSCHFLRPGVLTFSGGGRGCAGALTRPSTRHLLPKNFEKTALRKRLAIFTVKMRGGHIYGFYCTLHMFRGVVKTNILRSGWL